MLLLENQHWSQSYRSLATATHMNSLGPHSFDKVVSARAIPCNERGHAFTSEVQYLVRILRLELFKLREDVGANLTGMLHKVETVDFIVDCIEEKYPRGIANPSIISKHVSEANKQRTYW